MNFDELAQQEEQSFRLFQKKYFLQNPLPERPAARVTKNLGFLFWGFILNGIAACLLAASRTGFQFYLSSIRDSGSILAQNVSQALGVTEAFLAVFAFEFGILLAAIALTINSGKFDDRKLNIYIWIAVAVSLAAATARGLNMITDPSPWLANTIHYVLGFGIGPGATLAALASGAVVGQQYLKAKLLIDQEQVGYDQQVEEVKEEMLEAWNRSDERAIIRTDVRVEAKKARGAVQRASIGELSLNENVQRGYSGERKRFEESGKRDEAFAYIDRVILDHGEMPGPTEIANAIGIQKSSAHYFLKKYGQKNGNGG